MAKAGRKKHARATRRRRGAAQASSVELALAGLAHDIRTPLTGILALAQLLQTADLPRRERGWAEAIRGAADHLARLTSAVVDAARADGAGLVLREEPFALREFAESIAASLVARAEAKALAAEVSISSRLPARVAGDEVRLRSALENLIDNAVKFTERGRIRMSVSTTVIGRGRIRLSFTIRDSGMGMTTADLKRLFRPYAQASEAVARRYGGAGLGLVLVKRIARAMGGSLEVSSRPGRGSSFRLAVIVKDAPRVLRDGPRTAVPPSLRILCVEDNPYARMVLGTVLRELGHRVDFVGSGEAAVEVVDRGRHDVVLMDMALPGIDGLEAAHRIRALRGRADIPIIGVSGRTEPRDIEAAKAVGMSAYLRKPATPAELNEALCRVTAASAPTRPRVASPRRLRPRAGARSPR